MVKRQNKVNMDGDKALASRAIPDKKTKTKRVGGFISFFKTESTLLKSAGVKITQDERKKLAARWKSKAVEEKMKYNVRDGTESPEAYPSGDENAQMNGGTDEDARHLLTRCTPNRFVELVSKFDEMKRKAASELGFGSLLELKCRKLRRHFLKDLLKCFDPYKSTLTVHGSTYEVSAADFGSLMGVADGGQDIELVGDVNEINELRVKWVGGDGDISVTTLEKYLREGSVNDVWKQAFVLYAVGVLLSPRAKPVIHPSWLHVVKTMSTIHEKNWASACFKHLIDGVARQLKYGHKCVTGCVLFLQLFYLERVKYGVRVIDRTLAPIAAWNDKAIAKVIKHVKSRGGLDSTEIETIEGVVRGCQNGGDNQHEKEVSLREEIRALKEEVCSLRTDMNWLLDDQTRTKNMQVQILDTLTSLREDVRTLKKARCSEHDAYFDDMPRNEVEDKVQLLC